MLLHTRLSAHLLDAVERERGQLLQGNDGHVFETQPRDSGVAQHHACLSASCSVTVPNDSTMEHVACIYGKIKSFNLIILGIIIISRQQAPVGPVHPCIVLVELGSSSSTITMQVQLGPRPLSFSNQLVVDFSTAEYQTVHLLD